MQELSISQLKPGMMITDIVEQNGPVKIRKVGLVKSVDMVQGLSEMGVMRVLVDPAQSIEVEQELPTAPQSQTQKLLNSKAHPGAIDSNLSDQFNRSLFLPSVQGLPSAWHYYARQVIITLIVFIGGFGIGWTLANADNWMPGLLSGDRQQSPVVATMPELVESKQPVVQPAQSVEKAEPAESETLQAKEQAKEPVKAEQERAKAKDRVLGYVPEPESPQIQTQPSASQPSKELVSAELRQKFQQAIEDLENNPSEPVNEVPPPDVPPVHQLPAWVLTELPGMAFSTHMYATEPRDRWLRVNGQQMREGDWIEDKVQILRIEPQHVIMTFKGHEFRMGALTDW